MFYVHICDVINKQNKKIMYEENLMGKIKLIASDAKVWFGEKIGDGISKIGKDREKITTYLQTQFDSNRKKAQEELQKFEDARFIFRTRPHEADTKIGFKFKKLNTDEILAIDGSIERFVNKIKDKYGKSQKEATEEVKDFMGNYFPIV